MTTILHQQRACSKKQALDNNDAGYRAIAIDRTRLHNGIQTNRPGFVGSVQQACATGMTSVWGTPAGRNGEKTASMHIKATLAAFTAGTHGTA